MIHKHLHKMHYIMNKENTICVDIPPLDDVDIIIDALSLTTSKCCQ